MRIAGLNNWISELAPHIREELRGRMQTRHVPAGQLVREAGDPGLSICQVDEGYIKLVADLPSGERALLAVFVPGNVFGETAVICGRNLFHTTIAATDVTLSVLPKAEFEACYARFPEIPEALCRKFAYTVSSTIRFREVKSEHPIGEQVAIVMLNLAECSSTPRIGNSKEIDIPITIAELSAFLGVTRQTVQKEITKLKNARLLSKSLNRWKINDVGKVSELIASADASAI
ncbi:Crp/Fnr family transcriptional regulator [Hyphomonas adhaerens MHS-3]|uniref:Crp/Fnr family transcriptional regulator n=1 Tax=Hyphomonas adhaerens MHS-3 TaxID=1280949 RepID=A0A069E7L6_9PROT|nr:Crp/Fnr family transcriptional regulator [Hyphomonas adhaerens]KCZ86057.1 Crp/Fnr family transcriptional regulator [Hyphomonas adhaerens MHS-3]